MRRNGEGRVGGDRGHPGGRASELANRHGEATGGMFTEAQEAMSWGPPEAGPEVSTGDRGARGEVVPGSPGGSGGTRGE